MSSGGEDVCTGIISNPDISGPGVRIALYLQSLLSVLLVRYSPADAPGAYWSMTSTSFSLIISSIVTSANKQISLLDAIVVVYVLFLPILASAFGLSEIINLQSKKNETRSIASPLLIVANWARSALTYSFALYVWITAPTLGSSSRACNAHTKFIFFGVSLPALSAGRWLNLAVWSVLMLMFVRRTVKGWRTIFVCLCALGSRTASQALLKPKNGEDEVHREFVTTKNFATGEVKHTSRLFRPRQIFHELLQSMASLMLGWVPKGAGKWYQSHGKAIILTLLAIWAIVMTELELLLNNQSSINNQWGFGQILPMLLTISPLFSLWESYLSRHSSGPTSKPRKIRFTIRKATNLHRPSCELDYFFTPSQLSAMTDQETFTHRAPSAFAVLTIDDREMYTTYAVRNTPNPEWEESFVVEVDDMSTVVVRVFDRKCIDRGWPSFVGYASVHPFSAFPHPQDPQCWKRPGDRRQRADGQCEGEGGGEGEGEEQGEGEGQSGAVSGEEEVEETEIDDDDDVESAPPIDATSVDVDDIPLVRDGKTMHDMTISISISKNTNTNPTSPAAQEAQAYNVLPTVIADHKVERIERRVNLVKWKNKKYGSKKETTTHVYEMR